MTIQILGVQHPAGRGHEHVRVFGYRTIDPDQLPVEIAVDVKEATELISEAAKTHEFPEVEVEDNQWIYCLNSGGLQIVHLA